MTIKVLNYEGIIVNPAVDLAYNEYDDLVSEETKARFPEELLKKEFDGWDDQTWEDENPFLQMIHGKPVWNVDVLRSFYSSPEGQKFIGHSTGTTPIVSDCILACDGIDDKHLMEYVGVENYLRGREKQSFKKHLVLAN